MGAHINRYIPYLAAAIAAANVLTGMPAHAQRRQQRKKATPPPRKAAPAPPRRTPEDTSIRSTTLEVYQIYKPEIKPVPKPEFTPTLPPPETDRPVQHYEVPQQTLYYSYRSLPLRPLALGRDTTPPPLPNYIKAGGGNLSTLFLDAGIGGVHGEDWETAIHARHLSQKGSIEGQRYSHTGLEASGTLHRNGHAWTAGLDGFYSRYGLYGYNPELQRYPDAFIHRNYTGIQLMAGVQNETEGYGGISYHPTVSLNLYTSNVIDAERTVDINLPFSKQIDTGLRVEVGIRGIYTQYKADTFQGSNSLFQLTPALDFHRDGFSGRLGLSPTFGKDGNTYLLPDIRLTLRFLDDYTLSGGWQAGLAQNTFQQLTSRNPFAMGLSEIRQTRQDEVFLMLQTYFGKYLSVSGRLSWLEYRNLPLFLTAWPGEGKDFRILYDPRVNAISFQAAARYQIGELFSVGVSGTWYDFYRKTFSRVWHEPSVRLKGDLQWRAMKGLRVTAYGQVLDQIFALNQKGEEVKLNGTFDLGCGAEYDLIDRLSLFLNLDNLLNNRNERWLGYPSFGFNVYGGLRFRF